MVYRTSRWSGLLTEVLRTESALFHAMSGLECNHGAQIVREPMQGWPPYLQHLLSMRLCPFYLARWSGMPTIWALVTTTIPIQTKVKTKAAALTSAIGQDSRFTHHQLPSWADLRVLLVLLTINFCYQYFSLWRHFLKTTQEEPQKGHRKPGPTYLL